MPADLRTLPLLAAAALILGGAAGCATTISGTPLPEREGGYTVPLVHPLVYQRPTVLLELTGPEGSEEATFILDTGAHRGSMPKDVADRIGLQGSEAPGYRHRDVAGESWAWVGARVPEVRAGDLLLTDAAFELDPGGVGLVGDEILRQAALTIDYDRGVIRLGGPELPPEGRHDLEYRPGHTPGNAKIEVEIDGEELLMVLDTGAGLALDEDAGRRIGLKIIPYRRSIKRYGARGHWRSRGHFEASTVQVGDARLEQVPVTALVRYAQGGLLNRKTEGLLGWNFLAPWVHRIDPEQDTVQLSPRGDVLETVRDRIGRWPWVPDCEGGPGCVEIGIVEGASGPSVSLSPHEAWGREACLLLAFTDPQGRLLDEPGLLDLPADLTSGGARIVGLGDAGASWRPPREDARVVLLDVNPSVACEKPRRVGPLHPAHRAPRAPAPEEAEGEAGAEAEAGVASGG